MFEYRTLVIGGRTQSPKVRTLRPERNARADPLFTTRGDLMISLPLVMIASLMAFIALIAGVAGAGRKPRGAHRA